MEIENQERVKAKLFAGIHVTSEIKMHLSQNAQWKNAQISAFHGSDDLVIVRHDKHDYIGCYIQENKMQLDDLQGYEPIITDKLLSYCPRLTKSACRFYVFSQLFIF